MGLDSLNTPFNLSHLTPEKLKEFTNFSDQIHYQKLSSDQKIKKIQTIFQNEKGAPADTRESIVKKIDSYEKFLSTPEGEVALQILHKINKHNLKLSLMESNLSLQAVPTSPKEEEDRLKALYSEKRAFMRDHMKSDQINLIVKQSGQVPLMQKAIVELRNNYTKWDTVSSEKDLQELKSLIEMQHQNLEALSTILQEIGPVQNLQELHMAENHFIQKELAPYLDGLKPLAGASRRKILSLLSDVHKQEFPIKKGDSPITSSSIEKTADLFSAERKGIAWAAQEENLKNEDISLNEIYKLKDPNSLATLAYFKVGIGGEKATGVMEKLMWDIALIMGQEDQFVPTKTSRIRSKASRQEKDPQSALTWTKKGDLASLIQLSKGKKGGIQVAQKGDTLEEYRGPIDKAELTKGTITTSIFGMFDVREANIIRTDEGKLKFFDNTRSLPNSNSVIQYGAFGLKPSYNSCLLKYEESYTPLDPVEITSISEEIEKIDKSMKKLEKFLNSPLAKKQIASLPPGWLSTQDALNAMKERIANIKTALQRREIKTLCDVVFAANPDYKFFAAMESVQDLEGVPKGNLSFKGMKESGLKSTGSTSVDMLMRGSPIDPGLIRKWCQDPALSFEQVIEKIIDERDALTAKTPEELEKIEEIRALNTKALSEEFWKKAKLDLKDVDRTRAIEIHYEFIEEECNKLNWPIRFIDFEEDKKEDFLVDSNYCVVASEERTKLSLLYKKKDGLIITLPIDFYTNPHYLKLGENLLTPKELLEVVSKGEGPIQLPAALREIQRDAKERLGH